MQKGLHIMLWVAQAILATVFGMSGYIKTMMSVAEHAANTTVFGDLPLPLLRFIGASEIAGALGMVLPAGFRVFSWLTPLAAAGLATIMALAIPLHLARGEAQALSLNLALGGLAAFVAWGRFRKVPITPKP